MKLRILRIDRYIIKQFLGTFFGAISLILAVSVIFDINEKIDKFLNPDLSIYEIIFHYYVHFVPYYANMFAPLFVFISVIFFTTKLAQHSEIIAMLSGGISFRRLLKPYLFSASVIAICTLLLNSFVVPPGNKIRNEFYSKYIKEKRKTYAEAVQLELAPEEYLYIRYFGADTQRGYDLSLDHFNKGTLKSRLTAKSVTYKEGYKWGIEDYTITHYQGNTAYVRRGNQLDTIIAITPTEFLATAIEAENLTSPELFNSIRQQKNRGASNVKYFEIELHRRLAAFFAAFILTVIGLSLSSRKTRGGMGLSLALGIALSFAYIIFMSISSTFAVSGAMPSWLAAQLPNIVYAVIAFILYLKAPR